MADTSSPFGDVSQPVMWALGFAAVWVVLAAVSDFGDSGELAAGVAVLLAGSAVVVLLPGALANLKTINSIK